MRHLLFLLFLYPFAIPVLNAGEHDKEKTSSYECTFCMENISVDPRNTITSLCCGNSLHKKCYIQWMRARDPHGVSEIKSCPLCRDNRVTLFAQMLAELKHGMPGFPTLKEYSRIVKTNIYIQHFMQEKRINHLSFCNTNKDLPYNSIFLYHPQVLHACCTTCGTAAGCAVVEVLSPPCITSIFAVYPSTSIPLISKLLTQLFSCVGGVVGCTLSLGASIACLECLRFTASHNRTAQTTEETIELQTLTPNHHLPEENDNNGNTEVLLREEDETEEVAIASYPDHLDRHLFIDNDQGIKQSSLEALMILVYEKEIFLETWEKNSVVMKKLYALAKKNMPELTAQFFSCLLDFCLKSKTTYWQESRSSFNSIVDLFSSEEEIKKLQKEYEESNNIAPEEQRVQRM